MEGVVARGGSRVVGAYDVSSHSLRHSHMFRHELKFALAQVEAKLVGEIVG